MNLRVEDTRASVSIILFIILLTVFPTYSQVVMVRPSELCPALDSLFTRGSFAELEIDALRMLRQGADITDDQRIGAHLYLGFLEVLSERPESAEKDFLKVFEILPSLNLDPVYVPPKIFQAFEEAKRSYQERKRGLSSRLDSLALSRNEGAIPERGLRIAISNLLVPGSGFLIEQRYIRGSIWTVLQAASVSGFVYSYYQATYAHDDYMNTSIPGDIDPAYDEYNNWHKKTIAWGVGGIVIYLASQTDFHMSDRSFKLQPTMLKSAGGDVPGVGIIVPINR